MSLLCLRVRSFQWRSHSANIATWKSTPFEDVTQGYGLRMPSFRIRARNVLGLSPRIFAAPFFPATFHRVSSSIRITLSCSTFPIVFGIFGKSFLGLSSLSIRRRLFSGDCFLLNFRLRLFFREIGFFLLVLVCHGILNSIETKEGLKCV